MNIQLHNNQNTIPDCRSNMDSNKELKANAQTTRINIPCLCFRPNQSMEIKIPNNQIKPIQPVSTAV